MAKYQARAKVAGGGRSSWVVGRKNLRLKMRRK